MIKAALERAATSSPSIQELISQQYVDFSRQLFGDQQVDIYLHVSGGSTRVQGGVFGPQTVDTLAIDPRYLQEIKALIQQLDQSLNLTFNFVATPEQADISFYYSNGISFEGVSDRTVGLSVSYDTGAKYGWELFVNAKAPSFAGRSDYRQYATAHEFGHSLGLEHPFDGADDDLYLSSDYRKSAFPDQTVMAYRTPVGGRWPTWYQPLDLEAMQFVWGANPEAPSLDQQSADPLIGQSIRAESIGDVFRGGYGRNRYSIANDGITDWILISPDGSRQRSLSAKARRQAIDVIAQLGDEDQIAILGAKERHLSFRSTTVKGVGEGVGIYVKNKLEAICTDESFSPRALAALTQAEPISFSPALQSQALG